MYWDQIGVSACRPLEDEGGVVFSLSRGAWVDRSLLERFILANIEERLVDDLDIFGGAGASRLVLIGEGAVLFCRLFDGDEGGDCTLPCRSPSTLLLAAACGWSGGRRGTVCVLLFCFEEDGAGP